MRARLVVRFVGQGVDEVILRRIAREIGERQHDDRKTRGLGGRLRGDACGPVRIEEPPRAARDHNQQRRERGGERREPETPLLRRGRCGDRRHGFRRLRLRWSADLQRIDVHRLGDVLERHRAEIADLEIEPRLHLPIGVVGDADRAGLGDAFEPRGDIDAVAHEVAVALLDHVAEVDADPKFDALVGRDLGVALDHRPLDFNGAVHCVDDAAEFEDAAVARALDDAAVMHRDGRVDQVAAKGPKASEDSIFIRTRKPRVADDVGHQDRRELSGLAHGASAEAKSPVAGGLGMAAFPCCTDRDAAAGNAGPAFGS